MGTTKRLTAILAFTCAANLAAAAEDLQLALAAPIREATVGHIVEQQACEFPFGSYEAWLAFVRERHAAAGEAFDESRFRSAYPPTNFA